MPLTDDERRRYGRHLLIPELGPEAYERIRTARVLIVGCGGLGSPAALYLAAAGIGTLGLLDADVVELSNLQRQVLYTTADLGRSKAECAAERVLALNPGVAVEPHHVRFSAANGLDLVRSYDVTVTGVDNFSARFLLNDACVLARRTLVEAGLLRMVGLALTIKGGETACYRCLFPEPPPAGSVASAAEAGVLGPLAGLMGVIQATEVLKVVAGFGTPLYDRLLQVDAGDMRFDEVAIRRDPGCPVCGTHPTIDALADIEADAQPARGAAGGT